MNTIEGLLLIDKPAGWTSFDVVNYVRRLVAWAEDKKPKQVKVGHCGTLDPLATGLLVLLIGKNYTRRAQQFTKLDKIYEVEMTLGQTSLTGDSEGEKTFVSTTQPSRQEIKVALNSFTGEISQTPPIYSAIKIDGRRAYELARQGKTPQLEPRKVAVHKLELLEYNYPTVQFIAGVSSGTYIRSLVEDIGKRLKSGAYMSSLRRLSVGNFKLELATGIDKSQGAAEAILSKITRLD